MGELLLIRHGETPWSITRQHTGRTDVPLTTEGELQARALRPLLGRYLPFAAVRCSPLQRAAHTAKLCGLDAEPDDDLMEWDYGGYEGLTTKEIAAQHPGWRIWDDHSLAGESVADVGARADRVIARVLPSLDSGSVALVAHAHILRVLTARWLGLPPAAGSLMQLATASLSVVGFEHGRPCVIHWNLLPPSRMHLTEEAPL